MNRRELLGAALVFPIIGSVSIAQPKPIDAITAKWEEGTLVESRKIDISNLETDFLRVNNFPRCSQYCVLIINDELIGDNFSFADCETGCASYNYNKDTNTIYGTVGAKVQILFKSKQHYESYMKSWEGASSKPKFKYINSNSRIRRILEDIYGGEKGKEELEMLAREYSLSL